MSASPQPVGACPTENELLAFAEGALDADTRARVEAHVDGCPDCSGLLAEALREDSMAGASVQAPRAPRPDESMRARVGGYRIIRKLAVGGMAEIYLARLEASHGFAKNVVLKRILPHYCEDPNFVTMFLQEARIAAQLSHANIAQVFDIGEEDGRVYYTMELVDGHDLRDVAKRIHRRGDPPPIDLAVAIGIGIAGGLHYAHSMRGVDGRPLNIVHRDVTPSNILLTYNGVPKLLDFGVAKASLDGRESTAVGVLKGKLPYMSPEQIDGARDLDGRSDVFSLGVVLWEMTTLRRLYRSKSQLEVIKRISGEDAPAPSSFDPDYPPELEAIVLKALARDRDARYANAHELQRDLEDYAREARLTVSGTRLAELMGSLYAEELEAEREALLEEPRERTDSAVSAVPRRGPVTGPATVIEPPSGAQPRPADHSHSAATVVETPAPTVVPVAAPAGGDTAEGNAARRLLIGGAAAAGIAALLGLGVMVGRASSGDDAAAEGGAEQPAPVAAPVEPEPEPVVEQPAPEAEPEPVVEQPAPEVEPEPEPVVEQPVAEEPSPEPAKKPTKKAQKKPSKKTKKSNWNKNSLSMPGSK